MKIQFQTRHDEGAARMNAALLKTSIERVCDGKPSYLSFHFDGTTYDRVELEETIRRHVARGNQNIIVPIEGNPTSMVVEPNQNPLFDDEYIVVSYKVLATGNG